VSNFNINDNGTFPDLGKYTMDVRTCGSDKIAVDLGANSGLFETRHHNKSKTIYYFEAAHNNFLQCVKNTENLSNCIGFNLAVTGETGKLVKIFSANTGDRGSNSIVSDSEHVNNNEYHNVLSISIDDIFNLIDETNIHYMKIDIEGAEYEALIDADLSNINYISIEIHNLLTTEKISKLKNKLSETHYLETITEAVDKVRNEESFWVLKK